MRLRALREDTQVEFQVIDDGPGIPADSMSHLFDSFWQARLSDRRGVGLGLQPIAKGIVERTAGECGSEHRRCRKGRRSTSRCQRRRSANDRCPSSALPSVASQVPRYHGADRESHARGRLIEGGSQPARGSLVTSSFAQKCMKKRGAAPRRSCGCARRSLRFRCCAMGANHWIDFTRSQHEITGDCSPSDAGGLKVDGCGYAHRWWHLVPALSDSMALRRGTLIW